MVFFAGPITTGFFVLSFFNSRFFHGLGQSRHPLQAALIADSLVESFEATDKAGIFEEKMSVEADDIGSSNCLRKVFYNVLQCFTVSRIFTVSSLYHIYMCIINIHCNIKCRFGV